MYKVKCAWCGETLRTNSHVADSHGICDECKKRLLEEVKQKQWSKSVTSAGQK